MEVQSEPGVGTKMRVLLPALRPAGATAAQEQAA